MDFSQLTANKKTVIQPTKTTTIKKPSISLEGQTSIKTVQGYSHYRKVFQGCDKCGTEVSHAIVGMKVICLGCENSYLIIERKEYEKQNAPVNFSGFKIVNNQIDVSWCSSILFI